MGFATSFSPVMTDVHGDVRGNAYILFGENSTRGQKTCCGVHCGT